MYSYFNYLNHYKKNKKRYYALVEDSILRNKAANINIIWEFTEDELIYKDFQYDLKIKWTAFKSWKVIQEHLFISLEVAPTSSYILGEKEVGIENFKEIVEFVKGKIDKQKPSIKE